MKFFSFAAPLVALLAVASFANAETLKPAGICRTDGFKPDDGLQHKNPGDKFCVSLPIGELPDVKHMVSTLIISPQYGQVFRVNQTFNVTLKVNNLETGHFSNPDTDYYQISQTLNKAGEIRGHSHITIQQLHGEEVPDPTIFQFFKGLNDPAQNGQLTVAVSTGLPAPGLYRICSMSAAESHQPVIMPVAQRGAQDDCIRVTVVPGRGGNRGNNGGHQQQHHGGHRNNNRGHHGHRRH